MPPGRALLELIANALIYDLAVWNCTAGLTLCIYVAISLDEFDNLVRSAYRASAPAMWFVPAILLLSERTLVATSVGLLLIANTTRLLLSVRAPHHLPEDPRKHRGSHEQMFRSAYVRPATFRDRFPPVAGAIALQIGVWAAFAGHPLTGAALVAACAIVWTSTSKTRGAIQGLEARNPWRSVFAITATLLLTTALSIGYLKTDPDIQAGLGFLEPTRQVVHRLTHAPTPKPKTRVAKKSVTPVFTPTKPVGTSVPGVILRGESYAATPQRRVWGGPPLPADSVSLAKPLTILFSGEYHLFRTSSGRLPPDSIVDEGTPLNTLYATTNGEPMEMEAYQPLSPPLDIRGCGKIQMVISSRETQPGIVLLELMTIDKVEEGGIALFGLNGAAEETVNFNIPSKSVQSAVRAIRVIFQHSPQHSERNSRIAIQRFTLSPRL